MKKPAFHEGAGFFCPWWAIGFTAIRVQSISGKRDIVLRIPWGNGIRVRH